MARFIYRSSLPLQAHFNTPQAYAIILFYAGFSTRYSGSQPAMLGDPRNPLCRLRLAAHRRFFLLGRCRLLFRRQFLPIAPFLQARMHRPNLGLFLHDERRPALRARFRDGHKRRREIAIRIPRASVKHAKSSASAFAHASAFHKFAFHALRALDAHGDRPCVLALGVSRAADERAESPVLLHQAISVQRALLFQWFVRLQRNSRALHHAPRGLAIGIAGARQKRSKSPALDRHLFPAIFAVLRLVLRVFRQFLRHVLNEIAVRIARASQEESVPADPLQQFAFPALLTLFAGRNSRFVRHHLIAGLIQVHDEFFPEFPYRFSPRQLAFFDLVQFLFQPRREFHVKHIFKAFDQQHTHPFAQHRRCESSLIFLHVFAFHDRGNNRGVRRRPPDSVLFQHFH